MTEIRNLLIGLEIGEFYSQVAFYDRRTREAVCISTRAGKEQPAFPTSLCRLYADREWHFGREAEYFAIRGEGERVSDLYKVFCSEQPVVSLGDRFEPWELMAVFLRESLELLGVNDVLGNLRGLMVTTPVLDRLFARNVNRAMEFLLGRTTGYSVQDRLESFYYYCISKNLDTIRRPICLLEVEGNTVHLHMLTGNSGRTPITANVRTFARTHLSGNDAERDQILCDYLRENLDETGFTATYVVADGFTGERYPACAQYLTQRGRRAFAGNNLFVKGACFAAREKSEPGRTKNILFLSKDLVRVNIGTELLVDGERSYYPVITAGTNWYDSARSFEMIPADRERIVFRISGMEDGYEGVFALDLEGIPARPEGAGRLLVEAECPSGEECEIRVTDLGFGGLYPASGKHWRKRIPLGSGAGEEISGELAGRLCRIPVAKIPYQIASIGADASSIEEICYFLYNYPELIDSEILCEDLCVWFEEELGLRDLAAVVRAALYEGNDLAGCIFPIFRAAGYKAEAADEDYRRKLGILMRDSRIVRMKKKGDALAGYGKYISALSVYRTVVKNVDEKKEDPVFMASLFHNMGAVYMQMLLYEESLDCFKKAYIRYHTRESLRVYLTAAAIARPKSKYEEILKTMHVDDELRGEIDRAIASSLNYEAPAVPEDPDQVVESLMAQYRSAAGLPGRNT